MDRAERFVVLPNPERLAFAGESELAAAARLGLARVAFLGGQDELGERAIRELTADRGLGARDRDLAAQLLGNHYRAQGKLREAIAAYAGDLK